MGVRIGCRDDVAALARVHVQCWQEAYRDQVPDSYLDGLTVESRVSGWEVVFENQLDVLVVEVGNEIVGMSSFGQDRDDDTGDIGEVYSVYVLQEHWGNRHGKALMDGALDDLPPSMCPHPKLGCGC